MTKAEFSPLLVEEEAKDFWSMRKTGHTSLVGRWWWGVWVPQETERSPANNQQWNRDLRSTTTRNGILPTTWMSLGVDFLRLQSWTRPNWHLNYSPMLPRAKHPLDLWLSHVLASECCVVLSHHTCGDLLCSNRKLTQRWGITYY